MSFTELPGELLLDIFKLAGGGELRMHIAITFSHINGACRQLALSTPSLWSVLSAHLGADCATVFARRSQSLGLDIRIRVMCPTDFARPLDVHFILTDGFRDFIIAAVLHFDRWTRLLLEFDSSFLLEISPTTVPEYIAREWRRMQMGPSKVDTLVVRVRELREEYLNISRGISRVYESFKSLSFAPRSLELDCVPAWQGEICSPSLERLVLRNLARPAFNGVIPPPIPGRTPSLSQLLVILRECPYLRELVLEGSGPGDDNANALDRAERERVIMGRLRDVSLVWTSAVMAHKLFSMISLPALRSLRLHIVQQDDLAWRTLIGLRRAVPIEELRIRISGSSHDAAGQRDSPFAKFSNLCVLELDGTQIHDCILRDLIGLPRLRHLALRFEPFITADALEECILSRLGNDRVCAIEHLEVVHCENFTPEHETLFEELVPNLTWCADDDEEDGNYIPYGSDSSSDTMSDSDPDAELEDSDRGITGCALMLPRA